MGGIVYLRCCLNGQRLAERMADARLRFTGRVDWSLRFWLDRVTATSCALTLAHIRAYYKPSFAAAVPRGRPQLGVMSMKERPILMSGAMVKALLAGTKTQTRRIVKPQSLFDGKDGILRLHPNQQGSPYGEVGDRLWVRETWALTWFSTDIETGYADDWGNVNKNRLDQIQGVEDLRSCEKVVFDADGKWEPRKEDRGFNWKPSIFMPRWASRITLEITSVRVERLQDISETDAIAEGITMAEFPKCVWPGDWTARDAFAVLWDKINGKRASWADNPWVWIVEFKKMEDA
jgi:hypothetical protein